MKRIYESRYIILSFFLAGIMVTASYAIMQIYPFGGKMIVKSDLYQQIVPFYEQLKDILVNGRSFSYSWEGGLGKPFLPQFAYYTASPFSFLVIFVPTEYISEFVECFILLKIALSAASAAYFFKKKFEQNDIYIVIFSLMYAFMSYVTVYYLITSWLDAIVLLPLILLGLEAYIKEDKHLLYGIALAACIISNFYIALIVCIFIVFYYVYLYFLNKTWNLKEFISKAVKLGVISFLSIGISAFLLLPSYIALLDTVKTTSSINFEIYINIIQIFSNHFLGAEASDVGAFNQALPNIYAGILPVALIFCYYTSRSIDKKRKKVQLIFHIFLLSIFIISSLNYVVHGFYIPASFPHRFSFIYSFFILSLAFEAFLKLTKEKAVSFKKLLTAVSACTAVLFMISQVIVPVIYWLGTRLDIEDLIIESALSSREIIINCIFMLLYAVSIYLYKKNKKITKYLILGTVIIELMTGIQIGMNSLKNNSREGLLSYNQEIQDMLDALEEANDEFYRIEFRRKLKSNDSAYHHYNGYTQFSSITYKNVAELLENMGFSANGLFYNHYDLTPPFNSIFSIKYLMSKEGKFDTETFQYIENYGRISLYENNKWIPLGFMAEKELAEGTYNEADPFENQNIFLKDASGCSQEVFLPLNIAGFSHENVTITDSQDEHSYDYKILKPDVIEEIPVIKVEIVNTKRQRVFVSITAAGATKIEFTVNDTVQNRDLIGGSSFDLGMVGENGTIEIEIKLDKKIAKDTRYVSKGNVKIYASGYDGAAYEEIYQVLNQDLLEVTDYGDDYVNGSIYASRSGILFTSIPFDKGWKLTVDGQESNAVPAAGGAFLGIMLEEGEHYIELKYHVRGLVPGIAISILSVLLFLSFTIYFNRKRKTGDIKFLNNTSPKAEDGRQK